MNASQVIALDNGHALPVAEQVAASTHDRAQLFDFVAMLQTTLDRRRLLDIFATRLQALLPLRGLGFYFDAPQAGVSVPAYRFGTLEGVCCRAQVHAGDHSLGELTVYTREPLNASERHWLDRLLSCLIHPLLNAMRFEAAQRQAHSDSLTGVGNRAAYERAIEREIARAQRSSAVLSLLVIDLDAFKQLNDTHGHQVGDECLRRLAASLQSGLRESDEVFRLGGDEFVVVLPDACVQDAAEIAGRLSAMVASETTGPRMSASIGYAQWSAGMGAQDLFEAADQSLYAAKRAA